VFFLEYMKEACDGYGVDRLLLGMKLTCLEKGVELPAIYKDPAFSRSNHWNVSTSQLRLVL
jgi:carnitine O-acetyltransferase